MLLYITNSGHCSPFDGCPHNQMMTKLQKKFLHVFEHFPHKAFPAENINPFYRILQYFDIQCLTAKLTVLRQRTSPI